MLHNHELANPFDENQIMKQCVDVALLSFTGSHVLVKTIVWYTLLHMLRFPRRISEK